jgi:transmembrane sensor
VSRDHPKRLPPSTEISDEALRWVMRLNSGTATASDHRCFQSWRTLSGEHEAAAREAESLWADAGNLHLDPVTGIVKPGRRGEGPTRRNILTGAAALAALGGGVWASGAFRNGHSADYATGLGETRTVALPDGSRATLNARSGVALAFSPSERRVLLVEGQVFFEVAPDSTRPFRVKVNKVVATAVGTAFDVDSNLADGGVSVSVTEHAVDVISSVDRRLSEPVRVIESQAVVIDAKGRIGPIAVQPSSVTAAWRSGMYIAENKALGDVVAALRGYHQGWLVVRGEGTANLLVNAVLNLRTPDESLDALASGLPITVRRISPYLVIISG